MTKGKDAIGATMDILDTLETAEVDHNDGDPGVLVIQFVNDGDKQKFVAACDVLKRLLEDEDDEPL